MRTRRWRRIRVTLRIIARKLLVDRGVCRSETKAIITASFRSWATVWTREQEGHKSALLIDRNTLCIWRIYLHQSRGLKLHQSVQHNFNIILTSTSNSLASVISGLPGREPYIPCATSHVYFPLLWSFKRIRPYPEPCVIFRTKLFVCGEGLLCASMTSRKLA